MLSSVEQLLTIGEFAERCGLSRSALRFYDQNDLLRPQLVDAETGYRYYATAQIAGSAGAAVACGGDARRRGPRLSRCVCR